MSRYGVRDVAANAAFVPDSRTSGARDRNDLQRWRAWNRPRLAAANCGSEVSYEEGFTGWRRRVRIVLVPARDPSKPRQIVGVHNYDQCSHSVWVLPLAGEERK